MSEAVASPARSAGILPFILVWLIACAILVATQWPAIQTLQFPDPDDALRLQQVRDWIAGQSWFDVAQHRMNAPQGAPMHWSRLVDVPIAATILLLRPVLGAGAAELAALILVPLLTLGLVMAMVALITRRLLDREHALLAAFLVPVSTAVTHQLQPLRIDHHGWQMLFALVLLWTALDSRQRRAGLMAGAVAALWLSISMEGLPFTVAILALSALRWLADPRQGERLAVTIASLAAGSLLLFLFTRNAAAWQVNNCDAISPAHLAALAIGAAGMVLTIRSGATALHRKLVFMGLAGAAAVAVLVGIAPQCAAGPFEQLDPLVRGFWYERVYEGLPLWRQIEPVSIANAIAFPLIGLVGSWRAWRGASGENRAHWAMTLFMLAAAVLTAATVQRAGSVASLIALPGGVFLFQCAIVRARGLSPLPLRMATTIAALAIVGPGHVAAGAILLATDQTMVKAVRQSAKCGLKDEIALLNALPPADIAAPLDISPAILTLTHHSVVASGHHRNQAAMHDLILIFTAPPGEARRLMAGRSIDYVAVCPGLPEPMLYSQYGPRGLWALLAAGKGPEWLEPVRLDGSDQMLVWRVRSERDSLPTGGSSRTVAIPG